MYDERLCVSYVGQICSNFEGIDDTGAEDGIAFDAEGEDAAIMSWSKLASRNLVVRVALQSRV